MARRRVNAHMSPAADTIRRMVLRLIRGLGPSGEQSLAKRQIADMLAAARAESLTLPDEAIVTAHALAQPSGWPIRRSPDEVVRAFGLWMEDARVASLIRGRVEEARASGTRFPKGSPSAMVGALLRTLDRKDAKMPPGTRAADVDRERRAVLRIAGHLTGDNDAALADLSQWELLWAGNAIAAEIQPHSGG